MMNLPQLFSRVNTFVFDMDGVITDGSLQIVPQSEYVRTVDIKDGYAIQAAIKKGYFVFVITGSESAAMAGRLAYLGVKEFHQKVRDKREFLLQLLQRHQLTPETVLFMGDDMPDITAMQAVALSACPVDAAIDVLKIATYISPKAGGKGCVRDVIEKVMKLQGNWDNMSGINSI